MYGHVLYMTGRDEELFPKCGRELERGWCARTQTQYPVTGTRAEASLMLHTEPEVICHTLLHSMASICSAKDLPVLARSYFAPRTRHLVCAFLSFIHHSTLSLSKDSLPIIIRTNITSV